MIDTSTYIKAGCLRPELYRRVGVRAYEFWGFRASRLFARIPLILIWSCSGSIQLTRIILAERSYPAAVVNHGDARLRAARRAYVGV